MSAQTELIAADWVLPMDGDPIRNGGIVIAEDRIAAVGHRSELQADTTTVYDDAIVLPGFVNAHAHLEYAGFAGFGDGLEFGPWIDMHMNRKRHLGRDELLASARLGAACCLASGITSVADASFSGASARACADLGLRATVHMEVFGADAGAAAERFDQLKEEMAEQKSPLLRLGVSPHAPYTTGAAVYRWACELQVPIATHFSESDHEKEFMVSGLGPIKRIAAMANVQSPGKTGIRHLNDQRALNPRMVAAHCVTIDEEEIGIIAASDTAVAHCPRSNAQLGCGIAPLNELLDSGVRVGLGTDSPASVPDFDMFAELRAAIAGARSKTHNASALSAHAALELATIGSATALRMDADIGSLTPGKRADATVVSTAGSLYDPIEDPAAAVVYGGSPQQIVRTITDGTTRYNRGGFEWHELREAAKAARARMLEAKVIAAT